MKVLAIFFAFPPLNVIGSVRASKIARHLVGKGDGLRVISAQNKPVSGPMPLEVDPGLVTYTRLMQLGLPAGGSDRTESPSLATTSPEPSRRRSWGRRLAASARDLLYFPDNGIGWYPFAVSQATAIGRTFRPDVILASAPPFTAFLVAGRVARRLGVPWVADLRDLWSDNPYLGYGAVRLWLARHLEFRCLRTAKGLTTVSPPLADILAGKYKSPVRTVMNGFDPEDYPERLHRVEADPVLRIVHTGSLYRGLRDPSLLFEAMGQLGEAQRKVEVTFYGVGEAVHFVTSESRRWGCDQNVKVVGRVARSESLRLQQDADLTLLVLRKGDKEGGIMTGKFFEYVGAGRPILTVGNTTGIIADMVRAKGLGFVAENAVALRNYLIERIREKQERGTIAGTSPAQRQEYNIEHQMQALRRFLVEVCGR